MTSSRFTAYLLIIVGLLITGLCGACTLAVVTSRDEYGFYQLGWVVGGLPTAIGATLLWLGVRKLRR